MILQRRRRCCYNYCYCFCLSLLLIHQQHYLLCLTESSSSPHPFRPDPAITSSTRTLALKQQQEAPQQQQEAQPLSVARTQSQPQEQRQRQRNHNHDAVPYYEKSPFPPPGVEVRHVDDFLLTRRLGTGKFSEVFEAVDTRLIALSASNNNVVHVDPSAASDPASRSGSSSSSSSTTVDSRTLVVIKCLKPVSERKVRREVAVLQRASRLTNVARLLAVVVPPHPPSLQQSNCQQHFSPPPKKMPSLILEHAGPHSQWLCHNNNNPNSNNNRNNNNTPLTDYEIRYYLYHLLIALQALHSNGIMHRDVKPRNVLINRRGLKATHPPLMLIDLGLADFYVPRTAYNVRVASRHYKSPELLLGYAYYTTSLDLWGVGCMLAGLLLRREPFFRGRDNDDQLRKIVAVLGTRDLVLYLQKYGISNQHHNSNNLQQLLHQNQQHHLPSSSSSSSTVLPVHRQDWRNLLTEACLTLPSAQGLDLLDKLLVYDHATRYSAEQAMAHPFFDPVRSRVQAEVAAYYQQQQQQHNHHHTHNHHNEAGGRTDNSSNNNNSINNNGRRAMSTMTATTDTTTTTTTSAELPAATATALSFLSQRYPPTPHRHSNKNGDGSDGDR